MENETVPAVPGPYDWLMSVSKVKFRISHETAFDADSVQFVFGVGRDAKLLAIVNGNDRKTPATAKLGLILDWNLILTHCTYPRPLKCVVAFLAPALRITEPRISQFYKAQDHRFSRLATLYARARTYCHEGY